jgi:hypothetical protein
LSDRNETLQYRIRFRTTEIRDELHALYSEQVAKIYSQGISDLRDHLSIDSDLPMNNESNSRKCSDIKVLKDKEWVSLGPGEIKVSQKKQEIGRIWAISDCSGGEKVLLSYLVKDQCSIEAEEGWILISFSSGVSYKVSFFINIKFLLQPDNNPDIAIESFIESVKDYILVGSEVHVDSLEHAQDAEIMADEVTSEAVAVAEVCKQAEIQVEEPTEIQAEEQTEIHIDLEDETEVQEDETQIQEEPASVVKESPGRSRVLEAVENYSLPPKAIETTSQYEPTTTRYERDIKKEIEMSKAFLKDSSIALDEDETDQFQRGELKFDISVIRQFHSHVLESYQKKASSPDQLQYWINRIQNGKMRSFDEYAYKEVCQFGSDSKDTEKLAALKFMNQGKMESVVRMEKELLVSRQF